MISMLIKLDKKRIRKTNRYTMAQIKDNIEKVFVHNEIFNKGEEGLYIGSGDDKDLGRFIGVIGQLRGQEWFFPFIKEWVWYVDGEKNDLLKHYLAKGYHQ